MLSCQQYYCAYNRQLVCSPAYQYISIVKKILLFVVLLDNEKNTSFSKYSVVHEYKKVIDNVDIWGSSMTSSIAHYLSEAKTNLMLCKACAHLSLLLTCAPNSYHHYYRSSVRVHHVLHQLMQFYKCSLRHCDILSLFCVCEFLTHQSFPPHLWLVPSEEARW